MTIKLNKITIIGVGLIGGSFAKGLKQLGYADAIVGYGRHADVLQQAVALDVIDHYEMDLSAAVKGADLVLIAVPLGAMTAIMKQLKPHLTPEMILTDVGSAKTSVLSAVQEAFGQIPSQFVAGHPIAGKEKSGVEAACADLFQNHKVILTPTDETSSKAVEVVTDLWRALGAEVSEMTPEYHDEVLAATSHLPHLLAFGLVDLLNDHAELGNVFQYTAGGFRDFTRIASSDATMWRDIALNNPTAISKWLKHYQAELSHLIDLVDNQQGDALFQLFDQAKTARDTHIVRKG
ncbi:prephenate dehydrogenase/arogenate dehydrogenase family protein [Hydrogenovibrio sp. SC-1]|uniref:prephenate dehydrogenase n=1 Tax=Hydrogenovibrio sp. SC-1 TaxID=2065820 RepID=UPI000C7D8EAA|nr:prephenate dehydrogenase/arogenate dehydrogenase family protein [Hydrogenovibrio sp. SC-1]PLA73661.1 prephenate dehydrogenase/arogenate dehydrogenase family protein [Hydrogenovibrio sp. SC-1]